MKANIKYIGLTVGAILAYCLCALILLLFFLFLIFLLIYLIVEVPPSILEKSFEDIPSEAEHIPAYVIWNGVHTGDDLFWIPDSPCQEKERSGMEEVFCIHEEKIYFIYDSYSDSVLDVDWIIASIDPKTEQLEKLCEFEQPKEWYYVNQDVEFSERNGYYYEGQIVLNDHNTVVVYDIETGESARYDYDTYDFPNRTTYGNVIDEEILELNMEGAVLTFTLEEMAEKSPSLTAICALKDQPRSGTREKVWFLPNCVQVIDGRIYAALGLTNYDAGTHAIVMEYNRERDAWEYVFTDHILEARDGEVFYMIPSA